MRVEISPYECAIHKVNTRDGNRSGLFISDDLNEFEGSVVEAEPPPDAEK